MRPSFWTFAPVFMIVGVAAYHATPIILPRYCLWPPIMRPVLFFDISMNRTSVPVFTILVVAACHATQ
ncbi:hypothetical protein QBC38DRAFT_463943 [Podospora fimiseda]|uniref:Uncharacterized protein n=1 Tax=Podospora fimiseda TaxID=252190 RepID=A0AAN7H8H2_9PEZI|nr:hypothetical protein QBC38DRAFT_463943 [Podospora fimiseda]